MSRNANGQAKCEPTQAREKHNCVNVISLSLNFFFFALSKLQRLKSKTWFSLGQNLLHNVFFLLYFIRYLNAPKIFQTFECDFPTFHRVIKERNGASCVTLLRMASGFCTWHDFMLTASYKCVFRDCFTTSKDYELWRNQMSKRNTLNLCLITDSTLCHYHLLFSNCEINSW